MPSRREPLLWLQCLAIGVIPLELLLIRLLLAGADPGPVPIVERLLIWGVGAVAPAIALWQRPADWGSLLLLRCPVASRTSDQLRLSASEGTWGSRSALVGCTALLLPLLWWLDQSAGLIHEFSPLQDSSRLVSLLLTAPLLALLVWQIQQLVQALLLLMQVPKNDSAAEAWSVEQLQQQRSSFGLQILQLPTLTWPDPPKPTPSPTPEPSVEPDPEKEPEPSVETTAENDTNVTSALIEIDSAVAVEPEEAAEEDESAPLDAEIGDLDAVASGDPEQHGEQSEASGGEQSEPDQTPESSPGSA